MKIYFAGPLFSLAEKEFNKKLIAAIQKNLKHDVTFIIPQDYGEEIAGDPDFIQKAFDFCIAGVRNCDAIIAVLDGADADSGTCIELGFGFALGKPVIGVRTDFRTSEDRGLNLMVPGVCHTLIWKPGANTDQLGLEIALWLHHLCEQILPHN